MVEEAMSCLRRGAEAGHGPSQNRLGWCLANGEGSTTDVAHAEHWWGEARARGVEPCLHMASYPVPEHLGMTVDIMVRVQPEHEHELLGDEASHQWHV